MTIWIDMTTPPQVLFLRPIIAELERRGYNLLLTSRHSTETVPLADRHGLPHSVIGAHGGATLAGKAAAIMWRAARLINFVRGRGVSLAVSTSSYSQALAARCLRIPMVAFQDYEGHPANHIMCRVAKKILVPYAFSKPNLYQYGAAERKIETYGGLKENVYLADFVPDPNFLARIGLPEEKIVISMRPPSLAATYHRFENPLFDELLQYVSCQPKTFVVLLPRGYEKRKWYEELRLQNVLIPKQVLDGPNLIYHSDLVIGGGGTMNREATVLETPVYTVFKGRLGSVDEYLINTGKMYRIVDRKDFWNISICKKPKPAAFSWATGRNLVHKLVDKILQVRR